VFYKVGHHGSHNATLKEGGLEAMTSPQLVAAIPVDQDFANNSKHWEMPAAALYKRLQERTRGRILRADAAWPTSSDQPPRFFRRRNGSASPGARLTQAACLLTTLFDGEPALAIYLA
jgi:hypothetical protein